MLRDTIEITAGSCLPYELTFMDEAKNPEDVSACTFQVSPIDLDPEILGEPGAITFDTSLAAEGKVTIHMHEDVALLLGKGRVNSFRIAKTDDDGHVDVTEIIWINVR